MMRYRRVIEELEKLDKEVREKFDKDNMLWTLSGTMVIISYGLIMSG